MHMASNLHSKIRKKSKIKAEHDQLNRRRKTVVQCNRIDPLRHNSAQLSIEHWTNLHRLISIHEAWKSREAVLRRHGEVWEPLCWCKPLGLWHQRWRTIRHHSPRRWHHQQGERCVTPTRLSNIIFRLPAHRSSWFCINGQLPCQ